MNNSEHGIEGDWLGYKRTFMVDKDTMLDNFHLILSISKDSIKAINFKFIAHGCRDSISKSSYSLFGNSLIVSSDRKSPDTLGIDVLNETTLILSTSKSKHIYSRLVKLETKSQKTELGKKMFTISDSTQIIDTIEFLDNSSLLTYNSKLGRPNQIFEWRVRNYLDYEFLIIDSQEMPVFLIDAIDTNHYELKRNPDDNIEYNLNSIDFQEKLTPNMLFGKWIGKSNVPDTDISFNFSTDSVQLDELTGGLIVTGTYSLNLNGTKMFCFHKYAGEVIFYEIEKFRNDSMFLNRLEPIKDSFLLTREN
ncbi:MAG: hypothetical protein KKF98_02520 [Bacteroidetes bacterium]|nr:hypothetical protein [Bacteroidota bacterium]